MMPKLYGELRDRYLERPGGYTRVLRIEPLKEDQAPSAILELVDGPKDMRFAITAKTLAKERHSETGVREMTAKNIRKVTQFRPNGEQQLEELVDRLEELEHEGPEEKLLREKRREIGASQKKIYPDRDQRPPRRGGSRAHD